MSKIREVPSDLPLHHRRFFEEMRNAVINLGGNVGQASVNSPSNITVTPIAGGNVIQFTKDVNADNTTIYASDNGSFGSAQPLSLGVTTRYTDNVGAAAKTRYYWLQSTKSGFSPSPVSGPFSGTTLALNTPATVPAPPPVSQQPIKDTSTGHNVPFLED